MNQYRNNGAIGALLDEYERAITELQNVINTVTPEELVLVVDHETKDQDCISIQSILTHVILAGYNYAVTIRNFFGEKNEIPKREILNSSGAYQRELSNMLNYNEKLFDDFPDIVLEESDSQKKILVSWGQLYDVEQLFEHAIVHILRHRRQIERFLLRMRMR